MIQQFAASEPINQYMAANPPAPVGGGGGGNPYVPTGSMDPEDQFTLGMANLGSQQRMGMAELASQERQAKMQSDTWRDKNASDKSIAEMEVGARSQLAADQRAHETQMYDREARRQDAERERATKALNDSYARISKLLRGRSEILAARTRSNRETSRDLEDQARDLASQSEALNKQVTTAIFKHSKQYGTEIVDHVNNLRDQAKNRLADRQAAATALAASGHGSAALSAIRASASLPPGQSSAQRLGNAVGGAWMDASAVGMAINMANQLFGDPLEDVRSDPTFLDNAIQAYSKEVVNGLSTDGLNPEQKQALSTAVREFLEVNRSTEIKPETREGIYKRLEDVMRSAKVNGDFMPIVLTHLRNGVKNELAAIQNEMGTLAPKTMLRIQAGPNNDYAPITSETVEPGEDSVLAANPDILNGYNRMVEFYSLLDNARNIATSSPNYQDDDEISSYVGFLSGLGFEEAQDWKQGDWMEGGRMYTDELQSSLSRESLRSYIARTLPKQVADRLSIDVDGDYGQGNDSTNYAGFEAQGLGHLVDLITLADEAEGIISTGRSDVRGLLRGIDSNPGLKGLERAREDIQRRRSKLEEEGNIFDQQEWLRLVSEELGRGGIDPQLLHLLLGASMEGMPR